MVVSPRHGHQILTLIINDEHGITGFSEGTVTENLVNPEHKGHSDIVQAPPDTPRTRVSRSAEASARTPEPVNHRLDHGGINLSVRDIHYFAIQRAPRESITFLDFKATTLDPSMPLPPGLPERWSHTKPADSLLWLHAEGEATLDLVASIVVVLRQVC
ncbi:hypothetical protein LTV02_09770 [Nocardia yamanashiensis]|uniref:hypothetical protein n=1 Tax=Nocardia yamanashiensis TaxID=209247 RepID=UPI001E5D57D1|nr:hypothetical protein [Nocardia yamanashiensis]UGT43643.1 hypothetical protein LTV02_09770 [Nocardia yamanashiensis]